MKKKKKFDEIIFLLNDISRSLEVHFLQIKNNEILIPYLKGSYIESLNYNFYGEQFFKYVLNNSFLLLLKNLISYIKKKINDGLNIIEDIEDKSSKKLDKEELIFFQYKLKYPLKKISNLNEYIFSLNGKAPLKIYKNFKNIILQIKNAIIIHNYNLVDLKVINEIEYCIQKIEKNVIAINLIFDLYKDIKLMINNIKSLNN